MFTGEYNYTIDQKGRMIIPNKFRSLLGESFAITKGVEDCLEIYDSVTWGKFEEKINSLPYSSQAARTLKRFIIGFKQELSPDKMGRVQIPVDLRNVGKLKNEIIFIGVGDHIEVWDSETFNSKNDFTNTDELSKLIEGLGI